MQLKRQRISLLICLLVVLLIATHFLVPARHLPWRALDLNSKPGLATGFKLRALNYTPRQWCANIIADAKGLNAPKLPSQTSDNKILPGCGWSNAYDFKQSNGLTRTGKGPYPMNCPLLAATHLWLRETNSIARQLFDQSIGKVHHAGTYSCRRMYGRQHGSMSEHAFANAWDITGFELTDGTMVSVLKHWPTEDAKGKFLRRTRDAGCRYFNVVLGPDRNAAHRDHFHVDMGLGLACD